MIKIAVASGKGGTGKTFIATNIFNTLLKNHIDTVLVDCDAEAPNSIAFFDGKPAGSFEVSQLVPVIDSNACTYCGKCHDYCNYNAIFILPPSKIIKVIEDLCHGCGACSVACEFGAITEKSVSLGRVATYSLNNEPRLVEARMNVGVMSPVPVIKAAIKQAGNGTEIVILDSPPGTSCPFIQTVAKSDYVILVTEPTPFGLSDLRQSIETLREINIPCGVIINRAGLGDDSVKDYLKKIKIPLLMEIPFDRKIAEIYSKGNIVSDIIPSIGIELYDIVNKINEEYGNSSN
jgi:MinD superfamily P-loop ATPase